MGSAGDIPLRRCGFALVAVLAVLVLLTGLVVAFFSLAVSERKATSAFRSGADAQELARLGADIVIAQIRSATTQKSGTNPTAWASQPGAIRTYSPDSAPGSPAFSVFKLYSSAPMTVAGSEFTLSDELPPADWASQPATFVNLNRPVNSHYPIADPAALSGSNAVQGFSVSDPAFNNLAMPARWLYVLQDGSVLPPTASSGSSVLFSGTLKPTKSNPIVGRIAFWTDDESTKVNINTAGGDSWTATSGTYPGSFWSPPYFHSEFDQKKLAMAQPYQYEYQRYPGHPATVYLGAVFPDLSLENLMSLTPRYRFGGSKGGTVDITSTSSLTKKVERLYATTDELVFPQPTTSGSRTFSSLIDASRLEQTRFFLTANGRSSDLNLFGLPKVSAWPIHSGSGAQYRTPYDDLIALCCTLSPGSSGTSAANSTAYPFYFTRAKANDPAADFTTRNGQLYDYLGNLMGRKVPGFGGNGTLAGKWSSNERWQILTELYDYIRCTNLKDTSTADILPFAMNTPSRTWTPETLGFGQVVPTRLNRNGVETSGFGRFPAISEVGFMMIRCDPPANAPALPADVLAPGSVPMVSGTLTPDQASKNYRAWYQAIVLVELNCPSQGFDVLGLDMKLEVTGLDGFKPSLVAINDALPATSTKYNPSRETLQGNQPGTPFGIGFPSKAVVALQQYSGRGFNPRGWGGAICPHNVLVKSDGTPKEFNNSKTTGSDPNVYPLVSDKFYVDFPIDLIDRMYTTSREDRAVIREDPNIMLSNTSGGIMNANPLGWQSTSISPPLRIIVPAFQFQITQKAGDRDQYSTKYTLEFPELRAPLPLLKSLERGSAQTFTITNGATPISDTRVYTSGTLAMKSNRYTQEFSLKFDVTKAPWGGVVKARADLVRSLEPRFPTPPSYPTGVKTPFGDIRHHLAVGSEVPSDWFASTWDPNPPAAEKWNQWNIARLGTAHTFRGGDVTYGWFSDLNTNGCPNTSDTRNGVPTLVDTIGFTWGDQFGQNLIPQTDTWRNASVAPNLGTKFTRRRSPYNANVASTFPYNQPPWPNGYIGVQNINGAPGDWDSGLSLCPDGAYINKPDDGTIDRNSSDPLYKEPYFRHQNFTSIGSTFFSPNRLLPSPVMFGSLPTGIKRNQPWQTLLFNPGPAAGGSHPALAAGTAPDHLVLDLFQMPVVDPYALSEPFSTAGRVNLNTQILPFTYIKRDTALRAALRSVRVPVISADDKGGDYELSGANRPNWAKTDPYLYKMANVQYEAALTTTNNYIYHRPIDLNTTLDGFRQRMDADNLFRSATEICDMFLVPDLRSSAGLHFLNSNSSFSPSSFNNGQYDASKMRAFWTSGTSSNSSLGGNSGLQCSGLTGDNLRERPYALLYPLVTTKSNTYTVHVVAQSIRQPVGTAEGTFNELPGAVNAEWRGSFLVERQLAPTDRELVDYATQTSTANAESLHKIRVVSVRRFNPSP